ncbi:hypothetical protein [Ramlibacter sp. AN1133]|uniref:hypothetical protein n=1 Tax=Ramlibacter sp. AN1133 TaxID=3133429 RepID=UPI0030C40E0F
MRAENRAAKVTPEHKEEARRLLVLWDSRKHPSQAEFGELYGIGNQGAVSQFLRGETPLSINAARGFATGLGCGIQEFSPRIAAQVIDVARRVGRDGLDQESSLLAAVLQLAQRDLLQKLEAPLLWSSIEKLLPLGGLEDWEIEIIRHLRAAAPGTRFKPLAVDGDTVVLVKAR